MCSGAGSGRSTKRICANGSAATARASETLARSPVLRGLYDLTFAYRGGDKRRPSLAAGKGLQSLLMMINYEGSFMWRMRAGMGDVVFAPLYLALRQRGVQFHFFSRVTRLAPAARPVDVDGIELSREATVGRRRGCDTNRSSGSATWWCWPAAPDRAQLTDLTPEGRDPDPGRDFDDVVLAIPVGALSEICRRAGRRQPALQADARPRRDGPDEGSAGVADQDRSTQLRGPLGPATGSTLLPPRTPSRSTPTAT